MSAPAAGWSIREYVDLDEPSWLRCRVLGFLGSSYYDDVKVERTAFDSEAIQLVAVHPKPAGVSTPGDDEVIGILDVELIPADGSAEPFATIDTIAVHPDHLRRGIARALLEAALGRLETTECVLLDAWTREDEAAGDWYLTSGFTEQFRYVHVHKEWDDPGEGFSAPEGLSAPVTAFAHGKIEDLEELRQRYRRVYVCRRLVRTLRSGAPEASTGSS